MPSGAKRRKAAKKKQEKITNPISEESQEQGNGDSSKSHDEKDSDSGSVSSPTNSQEHHNPLRKDEFDDEEEKSAEPHLGFVEKSEFGGVDDKVGENDGDGEVEVTKEVDFESRVVDIEPWKESNVEVVKEAETSSNGGVEKKIEIESKDGVKNGVETAHDLEKELASQSGEEANQVVEVEKIRDSGITDVLAEDREEKVLPQSHGTSVAINNGSGDPLVSQIPSNSDNQPKDVVAVPPVVRPASWKSCCGLFDVFMGSNR